MRFQNGEQPDRGHAQKSGDICERRATIFRWGTELAHRRWVGDLNAAGFEHVTGRLLRRSSYFGRQYDKARSA